MKPNIENLAKLMYQSLGLDLYQFDNSFLIKTIQNRCGETKCSNIQDYQHYVEGNKQEIELFLNALYIAYSEFFRNPITFAYLEQVLLPLLIERKKKNGSNEIRIWSAACASGQEPYSVAILADELIGKTSSGIKIRVFATDIALSELAKAQNGVYSQASLNKVTLKRFQTYFKPHGDEQYAISPTIQEFVNFSVFDLLQEQACCPPASIYGNFDVVFCSNLLFYYNAEHRRRIIEKVVHCLNPDGYLITGESEREIVKEANFRELFVNSAIFQKAY